MQSTKIAGPIRIESGTTGGELAIRLTPRPCGRTPKTANYMVKFLQKGGDSNLRIELELAHGPDGTVSATHSTPITYANGDPGASVPTVLSGDADTSKVLGEYLHPIIKIKASAGTTQQWAIVEVFEMRKPF